MNKYSVRLLALITVLAVLAAACGPAADDPETSPTTQAGQGEGDGESTTTSPDDADPEEEPDAPKPTVRAAIVGDEGTLNPYTYVTGFPGWNLLTMQYDTIMQLDADGVPQPWLAESVEVSDDGLQYQITLHPDVQWNDGESLTAEDVAFTVEYFLENPHSRFTRDLTGVTGAEVTGDLTVNINLESPSPSFPLSALADVPIIPQHVWSTVTNPEEFQFEEVTNVASGPLKLVEYRPDQSYRFEANSNYFRGEPAVSEVILVQFADDTGALAAIRAGEVDVVFRPVSPEQIELLDAQDPIEIDQGPEFGSQILLYDATKPPFDDPVVRQAMSLAIDRQDLVDTVFLGAATVGSVGWIHPVQAAFNPQVETVTDVDAANTLLDEAGYADTDGDGIREFDGQPMSFEILAPSDNSLRIRSSELISEMLTDIGIQTEVATVERTTLVEAVWPGFDVSQGRNYEMSIFGWSSPVLADVSRISSLVHSDPAIGAINVTGFSDPEMDEMAAQLTVETDEQARAQLLLDMQTLFAERLPFIPLLYPDGAYAFDSSVYDEWVFVAGQGIVSKLSLLPAAARP